MILVDSSVWIDHLRAGEPALVAALDVGKVACHDAVRAELALGSLARRRHVLGLLAHLPRAPVLSTDELLHLVESRSLHGRGLSAVDAQLLGALALAPGMVLWTRDKALKQAAAEMSAPLVGWR